MNQPVYQPQQPAQQWGPPAQQPQQPQQWGPPAQPTQQPNQFGPPPNLHGAAAGNLFNQFLSEPVRQRANRAKPADGTYVVRFTPGCKLDYSQKDGRPFLLLEYQVIESTVPQMNNQVFSIPIFWSNRMQLQDLADIAKYTFGTGLQQVANQTGGNPQAMADAILRTVVQGYYAGMKVQRSPKNVAAVGYENAFANHNWLAISLQCMSVAQLGPVVAPPGAQPTWQPSQQPAPQMQPAGTWQTAPAPAQPAPQQAWQPPAQQAAPQPAWQPPAQSLPQAPPFSQAAPAFPQAQPAPAFYVPGSPPPR